jgi:flagellar motor switch protein FliN/FliY
VTTTLSENAAASSGVKRMVIDSLPITVEAILGVAKVTVGHLTRLAAGDIFALDSALGDPVELRLNGEIVAYGELVSLDEKFAVRIQAIAPE